MNAFNHPVAAPSSPVRDHQPAASGAMRQANTYSMDCSACEGAGVIVSIVSVAGEAFDADLSEEVCDACEGVGTYDLCEYCDSEVIDGPCEQCADDEGQFGVGA